MPELENKFQVIVSKRAAQQLVEHLLRRGTHIETQSCVRVFS